MRFANESLLISIDAVLEDRMRLINGEKVLLDFELAELLQIPNKKLLALVKREKARFPYDFMRTLSQRKYLKLLPPAEKGRRTLLAFTWGGIMMAAGQVRSKRANDITARLIESFTGGVRIKKVNSDTLKQLAFIWFFEPEQ
jgi:hypothetical protein